MKITEHRKTKLSVAPFCGPKDKTFDAPVEGYRVSVDAWPGVELVCHKMPQHTKTNRFYAVTELAAGIKVAMGLSRKEWREQLETRAAKTPRDVIHKAQRDWIEKQEAYAQLLSNRTPEQVEAARRIKNNA